MLMAVCDLVLYHTLQAEAKHNNGNVFRRNLLNRLQLEFVAREDTRLRSLQEWVCFVTFICNVFDYLKVRAKTFHNPYSYSNWRYLTTYSQD